MAQIMKRRFKVLALAVALVLSATACGSGDNNPESSSPAQTQAPALTAAPAQTQAPESTAPAPTSDLPSVEMVNVTNGATVNLASFAPSDRPIVLWFWAPH